MSKLRTFGVLPTAAGAEVTATDEAVSVIVPDSERRHDVMTNRHFGGVRVARSGQVSAWSVLP